MGDQPEGCARVTGAVLGGDQPESAAPPAPQEPAREVHMSARAGAKAPDFNAPAYYQGSFTNVQLSDFFGSWILLCFYPGDFTFV